MEVMVRQDDSLADPVDGGRRGRRAEPGVTNVDAVVRGLWGGGKGGRAMIRIRVETYHGTDFCRLSGTSCRNVSSWLRTNQAQNQIQGHPGSTKRLPILHARSPVLIPTQRSYGAGSSLRASCDG